MEISTPPQQPLHTQSSRYIVLKDTSATDEAVASSTSSYLGYFLLFLLLILFVVLIICLVWSSGSCNCPSCPVCNHPSGSCQGSHSSSSLYPASDGFSVEDRWNIQKQNEYHELQGLVRAQEQELIQWRQAVVAASEVSS